MFNEVDAFYSLKSTIISQEMNFTVLFEFSSPVINLTIGIAFGYFLLLSIDVSVTIISNN